jgi:hypothetical protein
MAEVGEAGPGHESDIAGADHRNAHLVLLKALGFAALVGSPAQRQLIDGTAVFVSVHPDRDVSTRT